MSANVTLAPPRPADKPEKSDPDHPDYTQDQEQQRQALLVMQQGVSFDEEEGTEATIYPPADEPFFYGYRYVFSQDDGEEDVEQVPLTLEDVLHPQIEDHVSQNDTHTLFCYYLYIVLRAHLRHDPSIVVLNDVPLKWGIAKMGNHSPDVSVLQGVHTRYPYGVFNVKESGGKPLLLIEVTSPSTRETDVDSKKRQENKYRHYAHIGVPWYIIVDTVEWKNTDLPPPVSLFQLNPKRKRYKRVKPDSRGWLWVEPVGLYLAPCAESRLRLAWYDKEGQVIQDYEGLEEQRDAARVQAETEAWRAQIEARRAEAEARRAEAESQRAEAEAQARAEAEARLRELEAELHRLRNGNSNGNGTHEAEK
jgi:colicin import membrane protein